MKKRIVFALWFLVFGLLNGCAENRSPTTPSADEVVLTPLSQAPTAAFTPTVINTPAFLITETLMPSPTASITPTNIPATAIGIPPNIKQNCLTLLPTLPEDKAYPGKVILFGLLNMDNPKEPSVETAFFDFQTRQITPMPQEFRPVLVSPDGTKFAAVDRDHLRVKIFSTDGKLLSAFSKEKDHLFAGWLDDDHMILDALQPIENEEGSYVLDFFVDQVIVNPFTKEQITLSADYPDILTESRLGWNGGVMTSYDPQLTRVVYAAYIEKDYLGKRGKGYVLWDLQKQEKLVEFVTTENVTTPLWAPDGSRFIVNNTMGDGEFYSITRDGEITQLSQFNPQHEPFPVYFSELYRLSPDGQQVAFWLESYQNSIHATLAILNTATGEITDYCIPAGWTEPGVPRLNTIHMPSWSPDGKYLLVVANRQEGEVFETLLIDLEEGLAAKIVDNLYPKGWLVNSE